MQLKPVVVAKLVLFRSPLPSRAWHLLTTYLPCVGANQNVGPD